MFYAMLVEKSLHVSVQIYWIKNVSTTGIYCSGRCSARSSWFPWLCPWYILEFKGIVADAFDEIICLEVNKGEAKKCTQKKGE